MAEIHVPPTDSGSGQHGGLEELGTVWERFVMHGELSNGIRPLVREAWRRSAELGVDPRNMRSQCFDPEKAAQARARSSRLIAAAEPFLDSAHQSLQNQRHLIALLDERAIVLRIAMDKHDPEEALRLNLFEGASWAEKDVGCNGAGSAIAVGRAVLFLGAEQFNQALIGWTCIGTPIRAADGTIVGALDFSVPDGTVQLGAWGWLREISAAIEDELRNDRSPEPATVRRVTDSLRNPFHVVRGVVDLVASQLGLGEAHQPLFGDARATVDRAEELLNESVKKAADVYQQLEIANERLLLANVRARQQAEQAEAASAQADRRAREMAALLQSMSDSVVVVDGRGTVVLGNAATRELAGGCDIEGQSIGSLPITAAWLDGTPMTPQDGPIGRLMAGHRVTDEEYSITYPDGRRKQLVSTGSVVRDEQNRIILGILVSRDVTGLRQMEQLREDFVRIAAHDMRQPLSTLSTTAEVLHRALAARGMDKEAGQAARIVANGDRIAGMIRELVDSARLEAGTVQLEKKPLDAGAVVRDVLESIQGTASAARLQLRVDERLPSIVGDRSALERVVENLVSNALKHGSSEAPVTIEVDRDSDDVRIAVTDRGPGIPPEALDHVFHRYFRAHLGSKSEGLGLGLYITRLLVEAHGGRIAARSRLGEGSTFEVRLPGAG